MSSDGTSLHVSLVMSLFDGKCDTSGILKQENSPDFSRLLSVQEIVTNHSLLSHRLTVGNPFPTVSRSKSRPTTPSYLSCYSRIKKASHIYVRSEKQKRRIARSKNSRNRADSDIKDRENVYGNKRKRHQVKDQSFDVDGSSRSKTMRTTEPEKEPQTGKFSTKKTEVSIGATVVTYVKRGVPTQFLTISRSVVQEWTRKLNSSDEQQSHKCIRLDKFLCHYRKSRLTAKWDRVAVDNARVNGEIESATNKGSKNHSKAILEQQGTPVIRTVPSVADRCQGGTTSEDIEGSTGVKVLNGLNRPAGLVNGSVPISIITQEQSSGMESCQLEPKQQLSSDHESTHNQAREQGQNQGSISKVFKPMCGGKAATHAPVFLEPLPKKSTLTSGKSPTPTRTKTKFSPICLRVDDPRKTTKEKVVNRSKHQIEKGKAPIDAEDNNVAMHNIFKQMNPWELEYRITSALEYMMENGEVREQDKMLLEQWFQLDDYVREDISFATSREEGTSAY